MDKPNYDTLIDFGRSCDKGSCNIYGLSEVTPLRLVEKRAFLKSAITKVL